MRAIMQNEWDGPEAVRLVEVPEPHPDPTEVKVRVHAAAVNPVDYYTSRGLAYNRVLALPFIHGWDVAGVVEEVGYGVTRFRVGDRVFGMPRFPRQAGGYAEFVTAPSRHLATIPTGLSFTEAAALPLAGLTAWQMLVDVAGTAPGQRVLVSTAAGGVGYLAVQIAKSLGAYVIGTARAAKHDFVRSLGADEVVDYTTTPVHEAVGGVDVVIQMFGGAAGREALNCLRPNGILVSAQAAWTPGLFERASELNVHAYDYLVEPDATGMQSIAELVASQRLHVHVTTTYPLDEAAQALKAIGDGRTTGKIVLTV
ncbi:NADP-dependent oxidoreductase [Mycolicibacterium mageritense]|uniref:2-haloacrylate reductase n=1 Tax=Mycolicibacterium mageritense TaxID=53462 RepID=A0AAI8XIP9_MYCME|nr:NADP-dependent oxidoreductase [Mycolicibacterium mageritense]BDY26664.1 2-haloacrylate reductase [Mycolicibacterium mageritense]